MKLYLCSICLVGVALFSGSVNSYELATHGAITRAAFEKSILNDATFRAGLGMPEGQNPFGKAYYDVSWANEVRQRTTSEDYEGLIIKKYLNVDPLSLPGWLMRGEDGVWRIDSM